MIYKIYITEDGAPKTGLSPTWNSLYALDGTDKSTSAPSISEVGGGWYKFDVKYGTPPFDVNELVGVIDAGSSLSDYERYVPVNISTRDYALVHLTNKAVWDDNSKYETIYDDNNNAEVKFTLTEAGDTKTRALEQA
ncbi:MAG: hypothetical protein ACTSRA_12315 [Promethearchaeota archaeon]